MPPTRSASIAYFSMEIALESAIPTYAGGLGVLAGDTLRAAADLGLPMVAVTLVHRKGYFRQRLDEAGNQLESPVSWSPEERLDALEPRIRLELGGRTVVVRAWRYRLVGATGAELPVYLLDTDLPGNDPADRRITDRLYGGDGPDRRLWQEAVLGLAGARLLPALGHEIEVHHMNEGHSALLALALLEEAAGDGDTGPEAVEALRRRAVFTTHTPIPAGHDRFPLDAVRAVLGEARVERLARLGAVEDGSLHMTRLALAASRYVNAVSARHAQVTREMFPGHEIDAITNGVHAATWVSDPFAALYDRHVPGWRTRGSALRQVALVPPGEIGEAHAAAKRALLEEVGRREGVTLDPDALTLGFARRATAYKRADLLFDDPDRLMAIARAAGGLQVVYAGTAHPHDEEGMAMIRRVFQAAGDLGEPLRVAWLEAYDMDLAARLVAGADVWLNTPRKPLEASGTSGMKAAMNGVPSLSVDDGWWIEGLVEGATGWRVGGPWTEPADRAVEAASLYDRLEGEIVPLHRDHPDDWARLMRSTIAVNGAYFSARRMLLEYADRAYRS